jgi:hypothetical protein
MEDIKFDKWTGGHMVPKKNEYKICKDTDGSLYVCMKVHKGGQNNYMVMFDYEFLDIILYKQNGSTIKTYRTWIYDEGNLIATCLGSDEENKKYGKKNINMHHMIMKNKHNVNGYIKHINDKKNGIIDNRLSNLKLSDRSQKQKIKEERKREQEILEKQKNLKVVEIPKVSEKDPEISKASKKPKASKKSKVHPGAPEISYEEDFRGQYIKFKLEGKDVLVDFDYTHLAYYNWYFSGNNIKTHLKKR